MLALRTLPLSSVVGELVDRVRGLGGQIIVLQPQRTGFMALRPCHAWVGGRSGGRPARFVAA